MRGLLRIAATVVVRGTPIRTLADMQPLPPPPVPPPMPITLSSLRFEQRLAVT